MTDDILRWSEWDGDRAYRAESGGYRATTNLAEVRGNRWFWCVRRGGRQVPGGSGDAEGHLAAMDAARACILGHRAGEPANQEPDA
jgi:hypothetical protein